MIRDVIKVYESEELRELCDKMFGNTISAGRSVHCFLKKEDSHADEEETT